MLGQILVRLGYLDADQLAEAQAEQYDVDYEKITPDSAQPDAVAKVPAAMARSLKVLPLRIEDGKLVVAMENPLDVDAIDVLQRHTGMYMKVVYTNPEDLLKAIDFHYGGIPPDTESLDDAISKVSAMPEEESENLEDLRKAVEDAPVVRIVNMLLMEAINGRASDIHLEPRRTHLEVRYRIDGELQHVRQYPSQPDGSMYLAHQSDGGHGHRRKAHSSGWAHYHPCGRQAGRPACFHPAHPAWRARGAAHSRPRQKPAQAGRAGLFAT
jgi:type IV pilus assembly protein PilB